MHESGSPRRKRGEEYTPQTHARVHDRPDFTDTLGKLRNAHGLIHRGKVVSHSHASLARALADVGYEVSPSQVSRWFSGHSADPGLLAAHALALAFGVSPLVWHSHEWAQVEIHRLSRQRSKLRGEGGP